MTQEGKRFKKKIYAALIGMDANTRQKSYVKWAV